MGEDLGRWRVGEPAESALISGVRWSDGRIEAMVPGVGESGHGRLGASL
jgi:hypothetical protein